MLNLVLLCLKVGVQRLHHRLELRVASLEFSALLLNEVKVDLEQCECVFEVFVILRDLLVGVEGLAFVGDHFISSFRVKHDRRRLFHWCQLNILELGT